MITEEQFANSNILIVEDEAANVLLLERTLNGNGYKNIQSIADPRDALEIYQKFKPDIVLLDLNMPHLNGFQVMEQINGLDQENPPPVMVLTGQIEHKYRLQALKLGARDFLPKPFDLVELSMRIRNLLEVRLLVNQLNYANFELQEKYNEKSFELAVAMTKLNRESQNETGRTNLTPMIISPTHISLQL